MSRLMEASSGADLLNMRRSQLAYGRRLLSAQAIEELARRATVQFAFVGCGLPRVERVGKVILCRRRQIQELLAGAPSMESARNYTTITDAMTQMHHAMQACAAAEEMNEVIADAQIY